MVFWNIELLYGLVEELDEGELESLFDIMRRLVIESKMDLILQLKYLLFKLEQAGKKPPEELWDFIGEVERELEEQRSAIAQEDPMVRHVLGKIEAELEEKAEAEVKQQ